MRPLQQCDVQAALTTADTTTVSGTGLEHGMAGVFAPIELQAQDIFGNYQETSGDKFYIDVVGNALAPWSEPVPPQAHVGALSSGWRILVHLSSLSHYFSFVFRFSCTVRSAGLKK